MGQGFFNSSFDDLIQSKVTSSYIYNARLCGFDKAFAWRLVDVRLGYNKEARFSYEAFGVMRAAYDVIKGFNRLEKE